MITQKISIIELLWSFVLLIGIVATGYQLGLALGDLKARIGSKTNGLLLMQAKNDAISHALRFSVLIVLSWFAYRLLVLPNPTRTLTIYYLVSTFVFIWIPLALCIDAVRTTSTRRKIITELERRERGH